MTMSQIGFETIAALDLEPIKVKLMHKESGEGWPLEQANEVEAEYRRFLYLMKEFPNELAAPRFDVDIFWHYHILDTVKYAQDCETVFGYFLHHFPYLGLRGEEDLEMHHEVGERMRELYEETFGEPFMRTAAPAPSNTAFSVRAPASTGATDTAFSVRAPAAFAAAQTAFSVRAPADVAITKTAFSVRVAASNTASQIAFSVRAPASTSATGTAFSVRAPASAAVRAPEQELRLAEFCANRPRLTSAGVPQLAQ